MSDNRFTWGESVRVAEAGGIPISWRPGSVGSICGFRRIENEGEAVSSSFVIGTILYTVEFADGQSVEVPQQALEPID